MWVKSLTHLSIVQHLYAQSHIHTLHTKNSVVHGAVTLGP